MTNDNPVELHGISGESRPNTGEFDEIRARWAGLEGTPWRPMVYDREGSLRRGLAYGVAAQDYNVYWVRQEDDLHRSTHISHDRNARAIAHAPTDIAALLAEVERRGTALLAAETVLRDLTSDKRPLDQWLIPEAQRALDAVRAALS